VGRGRVDEAGIRDGARREAASPRTRLRRAAAILGLVVFGSAVGMGFCEVALRLAGYSREFVNPAGSFHRGHPVIGYLGRPHLVGRFHKPEFDVEVVHDARGFRRQEHQRPLSSAKGAVYVFGDSYTWGWGVGQGEVFTDQLSLLLPDRHVDNLGLSASGTAAQFQIFDLFVREKLRPGDVVVIAFCVNDFPENAYGRARGAIGADGSVHYEAQQMPNGTYDPRRRSYLINLLAFEWNYWRAVLRARAEADRVASQMRLSHEEIAITRYYLEAFRDAAARAGAGFLVVRIPERFEFWGPSAGETHAENARVYRDALAEITGELDIETLDLLPALRTAHLEDPHALLAYPHDGHWTARGHAVAARTIAARLASPVAVTAP
jgi:lysophospholipase L1-like esterase